MAESEKLRLAGNELFKKSDFKGAVKSYTKALAASKDLTNEQKGTILSNRSVSYLGIQKFEDALNDANEVIGYRPNWSKGYFRKGEALLALKRYDESLEAYVLSNEKNESDVAEQRIHYINDLVQNTKMGVLITQLLPGRDICLKTFNPIQSQIFNYAKQMQNFIYLICDIETREALVVDLCWDMDGIMRMAKKEKMKVVGAIVTHYHFDHTGGKPPPPFDNYPVTVDGIGKFVKQYKNMKVYVGEGDAGEIINTNGVPEANVHKTKDNETIELGKTKIRFIHTPGHTPGSQCICINDKRLFTGDSLFIGSCGRMDFPDSSANLAYDSMQKIRALPDDTVIYPGHKYGGFSSSVGKEKRTGALADIKKDIWLRQFAQSCS